MDTLNTIDVIIIFSLLLPTCIYVGFILGQQWSSKDENKRIKQIKAAYKK